MEIGEGCNIPALCLKDEKVLARKINMRALLVDSYLALSSFSFAFIISLSSSFLISHLSSLFTHSVVPSFLPSPNSILCCLFSSLLNNKQKVTTQEQSKLEERRTRETGESCAIGCPPVSPRDCSGTITHSISLRGQEVIITFVEHCIALH